MIALVAVLLWLVYLLPTWYSRHQYDAAERNAVRLNQALRILAETSETPQEVRLELNARTALAQQKLARRAQSERTDLVRRTQAERQYADLETARHELAVARAQPAARRARARRRARLIVTVLGLVAMGLAGWGAWDAVTTGSQVLLWSAVGGAALCAVLLTRIARVGARRTAVRVETVAPEARASTPVQDLALPGDPRTGWAPRELPRPLTASAGSRAAAAVDAAAARAALRQVAVEEAARVQAERRRPPSIDTARVARASAQAAEFARMGHVDDAEIEAHVRALLQRRAAG